LQQQQQQQQQSTITLLTLWFLLCSFPQLRVTVLDSRAHSLGIQLSWEYTKEKWTES